MSVNPDLQIKIKKRTALKLRTIYGPKWVKTKKIWDIQYLRLVGPYRKSLIKTALKLQCHFHPLMFCAMGWNLYLVTSNQKVSLTNPEYIVCTPHPAPLSARGEGWTSNFQKGRVLVRSQLLEGGCWERVGDIFQGRVAIVT